MNDDEHSDEIQTANTMRERSEESKLKIWLLLRTNRLLVTGIFALAFFETSSTGSNSSTPSAGESDPVSLIAMG